MPFRASESVEAGFQYLQQYFFNVPGNGFSPEEKAKGLETLRALMKRIGPVVDNYPIWHPIVRHAVKTLNLLDRTKPSIETGYEALDHTVCFAHGFISCPYSEKAAAELIASVSKLPTKKDPLSPHAKRLSTPIYAVGACPVLVSCPWPANALLPDRTIAPYYAVSLMLQSLLRLQKYFTEPKSWDDMLPYLLGEPHGRRSSLFINQETGMAMKKVYISLVNGGFFEPMPKIDLQKYENPNR